MLWHDVKRSLVRLAATGVQVLTVLLSTVSVFAAQSVALQPGVTGNYTIPSAAPFTTVGSFRLEFRVHGWSQASAWTRLMSVPYFDVRFAAGTDDLNVHDWLDTFDYGHSNAISVKITGRSDFFVRFQRDTAAKKMILEVWNADGGDYVVRTQDIDAIVLGPITGAQGIGGAQTNARLAYFRWYSGTAPTGGAPMSSSPGDLGNWEFEGNGLDSSPHHLNIQFSGSQPVYEASPVILPVANAGADRTVRAGYPASLEATGSFAESVLVYLWQQLAGPTSAQWSDRTSPTPTVSGLIAGNYTFQVTITDIAGHSDADTVEVGAVATLDNGFVITGNPAADVVFGPMLIMGSSPWPWFDDRQRVFGDAFGNWLLTDGAFHDQWNDAQAGTISVTNGSATVTGLGTSFQTTFCGGGTTPDGSQIVIWYPRPTTGHGRRDYGVAACNSQTQLTLDRVYDTSAGASGDLQHARWTTYDQWAGGANNVDYYDVVMAYYSLYYRTGLEKYRYYARELARRWWSMPDNDEGYNNLGNHGFHGPPPRRWALTGIMFWATETGNTAAWVGIERVLDNYVIDIENQGEYIYDIREAGYRIAFLAVAALLDPNSAKKAEYAGVLEDTIATAWKPLQRANGQWDYHVGGYIPLNGYPGTVTVTNGSATVTGSNTTWQSSWLTNQAVLFYAAGDYGSPDPVAYTATWVSATEITLDRPYEGSSGSGKGWNFNNLVGIGTQPFMMGVIGSAWNWAYKALSAAGSQHSGEARQFVLDSATWIKDFGYSPTAKGLYYGRDFPNCEPIADSTPNCGAGDVQSARFLNSEVINTFSQAYLLNGEPAFKSAADSMFGAMWGKLGGPDSDDNWLRNYDDGGWALYTKKSKDFGFAFGFGLGAGWPAARLGVQPPGESVTVTVSFNLITVPGSSEVLVILRRPDGVLVRHSCSASPCSITIDRTQGDHLMRLEYLSPTGGVLASGEWSRMAVK
jgi:hypothetical protein